MHDDKMKYVRWASLIEIALPYIHHPSFGLVQLIRFTLFGVLSIGLVIVYFFQTVTLNIRVAIIYNF